jgi:transcription initiation factor TFIID subunit 5
MRFFLGVSLGSPEDNTAPVLPSCCFHTFLNCRKTLNHSVVSDDGRLVAASFTNSSLKLWDLSQQERMQEAVDRNEPPYFELRGHSAAIYGLDFSPDNRFLLSSSADCSIRLWLLQNELNYDLVAYKGHNFPVWDVKFSPLGYYFVSGSK